MADAKDAARGSRLSMESKKRHLDELYRYALKKCDTKPPARLSLRSLSLSPNHSHYPHNSIRKVCEGTRLDVVCLGRGENRKLKNV